MHKQFHNWLKSQKFEGGYPEAWQVIDFAFANPCLKVFTGRVNTRLRNSCDPYNDILVYEEAKVFYNNYDWVYRRKAEGRGQKAEGIHPF